MNTADIYNKAIKPPQTPEEAERLAQVKANQAAKESQDRLERDQWLVHPYSIKLLRDLVLMTKILTEQTENLAVKTPNSPLMQINLVISKTLKEAITYARTGQQTLVNGQITSNDLT